MEGKRPIDRIVGVRSALFLSRFQNIYPARTILAHLLSIIRQGENLIKTSTLLVIYAAISLIFGIGFLFAPNLILSVYGLELDALGIFLARILGATMLAFANQKRNNKHPGST